MILKKFAVVSCVVSCVVLALGACGESSKPTSSDNKSAAAQSSAGGVSQGTLSSGSISSGALIQSSSSAIALVNTASIFDSKFATAQVAVDGQAGGYWYSFNDANNCGQSTVTPGNAQGEFETNMEENGGVLVIKYTLGEGYQYPFASVAFDWAPEPSLAKKAVLLPVSSETNSSGLETIDAGSSIAVSSMAGSSIAVSSMAVSSEVASSSIEGTSSETGSSVVASSAKEPSSAAVCGVDEVRPKQGVDLSSHESICISYRSDNKIMLNFTQIGQPNDMSYQVPIQKTFGSIKTQTIPFSAIRQPSWSGYERFEKDLTAQEAVQFQFSGKAGATATLEIFQIGFEGECG